MLNSENKKLTKASRIALIGSIILIVMTIVFGIISLLLFDAQFDEIYKEHLIQAKRQHIQPYNKESFKKATQTILYIGFIISFAIAGLHVFLSWRLKKAKGRAIAITLIVLSVVSILLSLFSIFANPGQIIGTLISLITEAIVLTGAIIGLTASQEEYDFNRLD